jgi:hypothetical protein
MPPIFASFTQSIKNYGLVRPLGGAVTTSINYLVVAGGAGGCSGTSGPAFEGGGAGGGAGGFLTGTGLPVISGQACTVIVGGGGAGGTSPPGNYSNFGSNGTNSGIFFTTSGTNVLPSWAYGGGTGAGGPSTGVGQSGGSGGGGNCAGTAAGKGVYPGSTFISSDRQGYDGGTGGTAGGAGGGAGGAGTSGGGNFTTLPGGIGLYSSISGSNTYYAFGGNGGRNDFPPAQAGATAPGNTGSGGGGGGQGGGGTAVGGAGGSGLVIISYPTTQSNSTFTGALYSESGGNRIFKFNSSGSITFPIS